MSTGQVISPEPSASSKEFRDSMAALAATACVVTCECDGQRLGRTVTAVFSLAVDPPSLLISIREDSELAATVRRAVGLSFTMLSQTQRPVAEAFAGHLAPAVRFDVGEWSAWPSGQPRLHGALACMDCALVDEMKVGGHSLFVVSPTKIDLDVASAPLVWHDRGFNLVRPL
ncbi:flavin reductase family protein [Allosediminivita pacifica]|uniref:Flavin reductase (NADH)/flavin reductase n=1 Tax=Allosediminivita pacifica TaxID=1267769 RepID=A0A2T6AJ94_9RHOB|nr:flavin reductase family protein [Allosediminivita pacifica]PTX43905.1 flavin reductase (NADH)/flavin reductase [Allosediminivita pacifica]GGB21798.1 flavin reductase [Allosediminivita pacifica]